MEEDGVWRTVGGRRIFIKEGQDSESGFREVPFWSESKRVWSCSPIIGFGTDDGAICVSLTHVEEGLRND